MLRHSNTPFKPHTYVAFLRGINVGGHHKLPMADLRTQLNSLGFVNVVTLLNSGNVIFDTDDADLIKIETQISTKLKTEFGFPVPVILRKSATIIALLDSQPFKDLTMSSDLRLYISFLQKGVKTDLPLPWQSPDNSVKIMSKLDGAIVSVLDFTQATTSNTPKIMDVLEKYFGSDITTRNWNTLLKIGAQLRARL